MTTNLPGRHSQCNGHPFNMLPLMIYETLWLHVLLLAILVHGTLLHKGANRYCEIQSQLQVPHATGTRFQCAWHSSVGERSCQALHCNIGCPCFGTVESISIEQKWFTFFLFSVFYWLFTNMNADSNVSFTTVQTLQACMNKRFCSSHTLQLSCTMLAFTATWLGRPHEHAQCQRAGERRLTNWTKCHWPVEPQTY